MLVYIHGNYDYPNLVRQTPGSSGVWDGVQFTYNEVDECDYVIVLNHPRKDIRVKCRKKGRILIIQEPPSKRNSYLTEYFPYFDKIICAFDKYTPAIFHLQAALPWLINKNYDELIHQLPKENKSKDKISWITSKSNIHPGHVPRLKFLEILQQSDLNIDLYGRDINPIDDKFNAIYPYKYTFAIENHSGQNYWTEKITDAYLSWTVPIYYGCTNIEEFFPENSFIKIDINKPEEALKIIRRHVDDNFYDKNIAAIEKARNLILHKYQFFPVVTQLLRNDFSAKNEKKDCFIPVDPYPKSIMNKIKNRIKGYF